MFHTLTTDELMGKKEWLKGHFMAAKAAKKLSATT
jgi:hypothetical protein